MQLEKLIPGVVGGAMLAGTAAMVGQVQIEYPPMFADTPIRVEAPSQLTRDLKHHFMAGHEIVSGKITAKGEPFKGRYKQMVSDFIPYTIKTKSEEIYGAAREQDLFNVGDDVTVQLGWRIDCDCEYQPSIIEAFQKIK